MKKFIIVIVLIALLVVAFIFINQYKIKDNYNKLNKEIENISYLYKIGNVDKLDTDKLKEYLKRSIIKEDYKEIEVALKSYLADRLAITEKIKSLNNKNLYLKYLSPDKMVNDMPLFEASKEDIDNNINELNNLIDEYQKLFNKDKVASYLKENKYYDKLLEIYNKYLNKDDLNIDKMKEDINDYANKVKDVLNFLKDNKNDWSIDNNKINFKYTDLANEYNLLIAKVNK